MDFAYDKKFRFDFIKHAGKSEEWALIMFPADDLKHLYINDEKFYCDFTDYWDSGLSSDKKYYRVHLKNYTFWVEPDEYDELMEFLDERRDRCLRARAQQENEWGVQTKQRNENDYTISATIQPPQYQQTQQQQYPANQPLPRVQITGAIWWLRPLGILIYFIGMEMLTVNGASFLGGCVLGAGCGIAMLPRNIEEKRLYGRTTPIVIRPFALFGIALGLIMIIGNAFA